MKPEYKHVVRLAEAENPSSYGGKASQLCAAAQNGLPVPNGIAIAYPMVHDLILSKFSLKKDLEALLNELGPVAVRSSAVGEDGQNLSFAGQYISVLNVTTVEGIERAILAIWQSGFSKRIVAYKEKMGISGEVPEVGIIIQKMIPSDAAGILFSKNPVTGLDERVIEATWGLGEAVASGCITPDFFRMGRDGSIVERRMGKKGAAVRSVSSGGTVEIKLPNQLDHSFCLNDHEMYRLNKLTEQCERLFGPEIDIEWAFYQQNLYLLQCRPITRCWNN
jgi:pyruvate,water dikinase